MSCCRVLRTAGPTKSEHVHAVGFDAVPSRSIADAAADDGGGATRILAAAVKPTSSAQLRNSWGIGADGGSSTADLPSRRSAGP